MTREITPSRNNGGRPKGYASWKPHTKTKVVLDQVKEILDDYRDYLPMTNRQIFYRLVGAYGYPKTERGYANLCEYLSRARRAGVIPFEQIRDDGISVMSAEHYADEDEFYFLVRSLGQSFTVDKLARQEVDIRIYCEAAGLLPQIARVSRQYSVPVYSCSGFDSLTAKYELARDCAANFTYEGKRTVVIHLGDFDPSGVSIFKAIEEDVSAFLSDDIAHKRPTEVGIFERAALTAEQVEAFRLDTAPPKKTDSRSAKWLGETCQLEALTPDQLAAVVKDSMARHMDTDLYEEDREREITSRRNIVRALPSGA